MDTTLMEGIQQAGDVELKEISLYDPKSKKTVNLLGAMVDVTVYENLFAPAITGHVMLVETINLIETIPITGGELITMDFATPGFESLRLTVVVTKIGVRVHSDKTNRYTLDFISVEGFNNLSSKISRKYTGNPSYLAASIFKAEFDKNLIDIDSSDNITTFISPFWTPLKIINHLATRATYPNRAMLLPNFMFYQTSRGHKFKSLSTLFGSDPTIEFFFDKNPARLRAPDGSSIRDIKREYQTVKEMEFVAFPDYLKNMMNGAYKTSVRSFNPFNRVFDVRSYSYNNDWEYSKHLDQYKLNPLKHSETSGLFHTQYLATGVFDKFKDNSDELVAKRLSLLSQLETVKINLVVHGLTSYEVGQTIFFKLNAFKSVDNTDATNTDNYDKIYSGKYLITALQHRFTQAKHLCNMQITKEASFSEITTV